MVFSFISAKIQKNTETAKRMRKFKTAEAHIFHVIRFDNTKNVGIFAK